jgi:peptidoglycan/LPS O-acetylase OafA/YrhL
LGGEVGAGRRYDHIDALRALAALLVVWRHSEELIQGYTPFAKWAFSFVDAGRVGVVLFFAVSGFVIPSSLRGTPVAGTRNFVIRRFFRLYPAYWLSIPFGWLALHWLGGEPFAPLEIIANTTMLQEFFGIPDVIGVYWTLVLELVFYGICLVLFWCGIAHRSMTFCVFTALTAFGAWFYGSLSRYVFYVDQKAIQTPKIWYKIGHYVVADPTNLWGDSRFMFLVFLSVMGLGALIRFWHDQKAGRFDKIFIITAVGCWSIGFLIIPIAYHIRGRTSLIDVCTFLSHSIPIIAFFILSSYWKIHSRILSYLGLISYSLYLFHAVIIYSLRNFLQHHFPVLQSAPSLLVVVAILLSVGAAAVIFTFIEKPAIEFSRRLTNIPSRNPRMSHSLAANY